MMICFFCSFLLNTLFCSRCGRRNPENERQHWIAEYFRRGNTNQEILSQLSNVHQIDIGERTLRRELVGMNLRRRNSLNASNYQRMIDAITVETGGASQNSGYRSIWTRLSLFHGRTVPRDAVMRAMRQLDPQRSTERRRTRLHRRTYSNPGPVWAYRWLR